MPPALITFSETAGSGYLAQLNKADVYTSGPTSYPDPFYAMNIPASPLIPILNHHGGYLWDTYGCAGRTGGPKAHCGAAQGPYPFWQIVSSSGGASAAQPSNVTVYSDNHGEAMVSLTAGAAVVRAKSTTTVQAVASYPYFRGLRPPVASAPIDLVF